jgi:hypothetical protein
LGAVVYVCSDETLLLFQTRITIGVASKGSQGVVVVVHPFREVIGKFVSSCVGTCVLEINDDELFVLVGRLKEW